MKRLIIVIAFTLSITLGGLAQKVIFNKNYKTNKQEYKVAIMPYFSKGAKEINDIVYQNLNRGKFIIADTSVINYNIRNHDTFNNTLRKFTYIDINKRYLKENPNLYINFNNREIEDFKINTLKSDILIMGSALEGKTVLKVNGSGYKLVSGSMVVFDLNTGDFILQCFNKVKVRYKKMNNDAPLPYKELLESIGDCLNKNLNK